MRTLNILYEDNSVIIINKPAGLAVQGGAGIKTSLDKLLALYKNPPPLLVHRLDKDTSGVILTAKTKEAASRFSAFFSNADPALDKAVKRYIAVCSGSPKEKQGIIKDKLEIKGKVKKSKTIYKVIKEGKLDINNEDLNYSVLEIELGTGRMHQIRRHLAMTGCPVLQDDKYGNFSLNKKLKKTGIKHLLLHSCRLIIKNCRIDVTCPLPEYFNIFNIN